MSKRFTLRLNREDFTTQVKKGIYRHFKGNEYEVMDIGYDCETAKEVVIYKALYGDGKIWVRPKNNFLGIVYRDNRFMKRFELVK